LKDWPQVGKEENAVAVVRGITRKNMRIYCTGVHRLHSLVLLVKVFWIQGRDLEGEGKLFGSKLFECTTKKRNLAFELNHQFC
jgi:hypothetical protein